MILASNALWCSIAVPISEDVLLIPVNVIPRALEIDLSCILTVLRSVSISVFPCCRTSEDTVLLMLRAIYGAE